MSVYETPWTDEDVADLCDWQTSERFHPYTCGSCIDESVLIPTRNGWRCPRCCYEQKWCLSFSVKKGGTDDPALPSD